MTAPDALSRLCDLYGIALDYFDIWGNHHQASVQTQRALLSAMGISAATEAGAQQALETFEAAQWHRVLPPVQVVRKTEAPFEILVTLPASAGQDKFGWALIQESGERFEGKFSLSALQVLEKHRIGETHFARYTFPLPRTPGIGYHRFELNWRMGQEDRSASMSLIVAPATCYQPPTVEREGRVWGPAVQLYSLRSDRNWGLGDFSDLKALVEFCAEQGAGVIGVSPLHALFPDNPEHASPYGPSSRLFLNVLYLDVEAIPDFAECESARKAVRAPQFQAQLRALRAEELVQYGAVAAAKFQIQLLLYKYFRERHLDIESERGQAFRAYQAARGAALRRQALFETLQAQFRHEDASVWGWPAWPSPYHDPTSPAVAAFCTANLEQVEFYEYLQWQAHLQLAAVGHRSSELGLGLGLLLDLAVSVSRGGAETWASQKYYAVEAGIGAPPDDFNLHGQDWGLPPLIPHRLAEAAYAPFIATLRECMCDAGALRIDHVMGLQRLFWIPRGGRPEDGAYVYYPVADLLGILALESQRNRCLVVGEDLGTVPDSMREALQPLGVLSYRLLYFEKNADGAFKSPADYPAQALAAVSTHDLATLAGYWAGRDLDLRSELGLFSAEAQREAQIVTRAQERALLLMALEREGLLPAGGVPNPVLVPEMSPEYVQAVYAYIARCPAKLALLQLEDVLGQLDQVNLPGTTEHQYPNWRRKLPLNLEEWRGDPRMLSLAEALRRERGSSVQPQPRPVPAQSLRLLPRVPRATYRLQFNREFTFSQATELVTYLHQLGISHCYASSYLKARPGSSHGYDIINHNALNPEIGSTEEFERFVAVLHEHDMGQILDMVPNHMGIMGSDNIWWLDVLENGLASNYAQFFDIDWFPYKDELRGKVLLPVLGGHYGAVLENGELKLVFNAARGEFSIFYYQHCFPIDPGEYTRILGYGLDRLGARLGWEHPAALEFQSLITAFGYLPGRMETEQAKTAERNRDKEIHKQRLAGLYADSADIARYVDDNVAEFNAGTGEAVSFNLMHELLEAQAYRLAYWRVASDEINYRRFFDINDLAALRMENADVFEATHRLMLDLLATGKVDGLRIDHPDGLYDPVQYFQRLQTHIMALEAMLVAANVDSGEADKSAENARQLYIVVEKILAAHERLPANWPVSGTTGYDFANQCNGLFVNPAMEEKMERAYIAFTGARIDYDELLYASKKLIMKTAMAGELNVLAHQLSRIAEANRHTCDFTMNSLSGALAEIVACFPVYRTYVSAHQVSPEDIHHIDWAVAIAKKRSLAADLDIFDFVRDVLLKVWIEGKSQPYRDTVTAFAMKFQQFSSPVMAKGMEDTSFYLYNRLVSLNEVGGDPRRFGMPLNAFHRANQDRARHFPHAMLTTSTHDSKRSEDVRARLNVLSELPDEWRRAVTRWSRINRSRSRTVDGMRVPSRNDEYLLYQTLVGVWPLGNPDDAGWAAFSDRIVSYMMKAAREAKAHSSWINPNTVYEEGVTYFVRSLVAPGTDNRFLVDFLPFQRRIARLGMFNSLSQVLIKLTAPGVPDIYQGNELWDFSLVDPDNRRPVDYEQRRAMLAELQSIFAVDSRETASRAHGLLQSMEDGRIKLYLNWKTLSLRQQEEALFCDGEYLPLKAEGNRAEHLCAYARRGEGNAAIVIAPRWFAALSEGEQNLPLGAGIWADTRIVVPLAEAGSQWVNVFTDEVLALREQDGLLFLDAAEVFQSFPYALLVGRR